MALHLVTGRAGKEHVTPADQGAFHVATLIDGNYVFQRGNQFGASIVSNNSIKILDGELLMQGRYVRFESGSFEEVAIENGTQGYKRNDLIVVRYTKDATTTVESVSFVVIKGTASTDEAVDPEHTEGNLLDGDLTVDFPLYRVPLDGLTVGELVPLFDVVDNFDGRIKDLQSYLTGLIDGTTVVGNSAKVNGFGFFSNISELGITSYHIPEIVKAMPGNSIYITRVINGSTYQLDAANNSLPEKNGLLEIIKGGSGGRTRVLYSCGTNTAKANVYLCDLDETNWAINGWQRLGEGGDADSLEGYAASDFILNASKPIGTYTGNGDATERIINIGTDVVGRVLFIYSDHGHGFVSPSGGTFFGKGQASVLTHFEPSQSQYWEGNMTIACDDDYLNGSGSTYRYSLL